MFKHEGVCGTQTSALPGSAGDRGWVAPAAKLPHTLGTPGCSPPCLPECGCGCRRTQPQRGPSSPLLPTELCQPEPAWRRPSGWSYVPRERQPGGEGPRGLKKCGGGRATGRQCKGPGVRHARDQQRGPKRGEWGAGEFLTHRKGPGSTEAGVCMGLGARLPRVAGCQGTVLVECDDSQRTRVGTLGLLSRSTRYLRPS